MEELAEEIQNEFDGNIQLGITPPDVLVEAIDKLIEDEVLPCSYLNQLSAEILRYNTGIYDVNPGRGSLDGKPTPQAMLRLSFLLFCARVLNYEIFQDLRREKQDRLASGVFKYIKELETLSRAFDNSYRNELKTSSSPAISSAFWEGRTSHPVEAARRLVCEAYTI